MPRVNEELGKDRNPKASALAGNWLAATNTAEIRNQFQRVVIEANDEGSVVPTWEVWVQEQGYRLDPQGNVLRPAK